VALAEGPIGGALCEGAPLVNEADGKLEALTAGNTDVPLAPEAVVVEARGTVLAPLDVGTTTAVPAVPVDVRGVVSGAAPGVLLQAVATPSASALRSTREWEVERLRMGTVSATG
jgi:hypothetical protein